MSNDILKTVKKKWAKGEGVNKEELEAFKKVDRQIRNRMRKLNDVKRMVYKLTTALEDGDLEIDDEDLESLQRALSNATEYL